MHPDRPHLQPLMLVALFAIGAVSVLGYSWATRGDPPGHSRVEARTSAPSERAANPPNLSSEAAESLPASEPDQSVQHSPSASAGRPPPPLAPLSVDEMVVNATQSDGETRAAAIAALGNAPRDEALPALESLINTADDEGRALAMQALRTLALNQGDEDGRIRDAVRKVIYHGSDETGTASAQAALDGIERDLD